MFAVCASMRGTVSPMVPAVACVQVSRAIDDARRQRSTKDILDF